jgi:tetratricopeptide (TPR) repeat protein
VWGLDCSHGSAGAVEDFNVAIEVEPRYSDSWKRRGQARSALGDHEGALADLQKAIDLAPLFGGGDSATVSAAGPGATLAAGRAGPGQDRVRHLFEHRSAPRHSGRTATSAIMQPPQGCESPSVSRPP